MLDLLYKIDEWLISSIFEPVAWRYEYHTGYTYRRLERYMLWVSFAAGASAHMILGDKTIAVLLLLVLITVDTFHLSKRNEKTSISTDTILINPYRGRRGGRIVIATYCLGNSLLEGFVYTSKDYIISLLFIIFLLFYAIKEYFGACNQMPPSVRKKLEEEEVDRVAQNSIA